MTTAVKRACDACHRRKVKCDGINPCRNCSSAQLACTYHAIPQKKGPKGSRAKVISELRETQRQSSLSGKVQNRMNGVNGPASSTLAPTPGLLSPEMVKECIEFFFANMYPIMPIVERQRLQNQVMFMEQSTDTYCLVSSLCAFMMFQPGMNLPGSDPYGMDSMVGANLVTATLLMEETIKVRKSYDHLEAPTLNTLCTSYFLFACYHNLELHEKAWYHLREATTLAYMMGMTNEETYRNYDSNEGTRRRRLYWLLFVSERAFAFKFQRPLTLQATINPPTLTDDPSDPLAHQLNGFLLLVNLFRPFDDAFVNLWNKARSACNSNYLNALQKQFTEVFAAYATADAQLSDLGRNQQWLKNLNWQIGMSHGSDMSMPYPIDVSRELLSMSSAFPSQGMDWLNAGLIDKLVSVTSDLTDVLSVQPASRDPYTVGPREQLNQLASHIAIIRNGEHRFMPLLMSKVHEILPRLCNPILQHAPDNACMANVDIFDGFGNAGMAQPPCLPIDEYDNKFSVSHVDEFKTESPGSSGSVPSSAEANSSFISSPPILSPGVEYPHGVPASFSHMGDMVMSPMGPGPGSSLDTQGGMGARSGQHQHMNPQLQQTLNHSIGQAASMSLNGQGVDQQHVLSSQGLHSAMGSMASNGAMMRPQPSRSNSFAIQQPQIRTVGDFHALQRANSDMSAIGPVGMNNMGSELNFTGLR